MNLTSGRSTAGSTKADLSGLLLIEDNADAYAARRLSARSATATLDLMYYIWRPDACGHALLADIIAAADRGVAVRMLIDDANPIDSDRIYLQLNSHPKIELRVFNPSSIRRRGLLRWGEMAWRLGVLNRRMHAKAWIADNRFAIVGGRNIGDEYFGEARTNFRDLDLLLLGDAVQQTSRVFEAFWNHALARPVHLLNKGARRGHSFADEASRGTGPRQPVDGKRSIEDFIAAQPRIHWVHGAKVLADPPDKALGRQPENWLMKSLLPVIRSCARRLEIISPYFIPGQRGVEILADLIRKGAVVTVLTNSLAATDVAAVHGAYANYRRRLLRCGISLFEFQPFDRAKFSVFGSKGASLHTKALAVDDRIGFVGSFNFDPRSVSLNAEMGILFEAEALVEELMARIDQEKQADGSYWVDLHYGFLRWVGNYQGRLRQFRTEPEAGVWRRLLATLFRWLPAEAHL